jgi:hypothetical protein
MATRKVVEVYHALATWNITQGSAPGGLTKAELDALVNGKLNEGWDLPEGNVLVIKTNFGERGDVTHLTSEYIFVKYEDAPAVKAK